MTAVSSSVLVSGANGLVGARVCERCAARGVTVRALVRRAGTAPRVVGVEEVVGEISDLDQVRRALEGVDAVVNTVYPLGDDDRDRQRQVSVKATVGLARAAVDTGAGRLIHVSTAAVYDRSPGTGDVDESSTLVAGDSPDYGVIKRDTDRALAEVDGITRVLVRPPAVLGPGPSSVWNTRRPADMRTDVSARTGVPAATFPWVHIDDLAGLVTDLLAGVIVEGDDLATGPLSGGCTPVNVTGAPTATQRDYLTAVTDALGVDPVWDDAPGWTGQILADRARGWGWRPRVSLQQALDQLVAGLTRDPAN